METVHASRQNEQRVCVCARERLYVYLSVSFCVGDVHFYSTMELFVNVYAFMRLGEPAFLLLLFDIPLLGKHLFGEMDESSTRALQTWLECLTTRPTLDYTVTCTG